MAIFAIRLSFFGWLNSLGLLLACIICPVASHRQTGPVTQQQCADVPRIREHTAKRNLRKAAYRAARSDTQCATYRGNTYSAESLRRMAGLPTATMCEPRRTRQGQGRDPTTCTQARLRVMTWNAGGLPRDAWMEFQLWLHEQREYDVIMVQETHWRFSSQFNLPRYHALHSGRAVSRLSTNGVVRRRTYVGPPRLEDIYSMCVFRISASTLI